MYRTICALAALAMTAGTVAFAAPARAATPDDNVTVTVSLEGLSPADPADAGRIERRIRNAARGLCGSQSVQPVRLMQKAAACEKAITAEARNEVELAGARQSGPIRLSLRSN